MSGILGKKKKQWWLAGLRWWTFTSSSMHAGKCSSLSCLPCQTHRHFWLSEIVSHAVCGIPELTIHSRITWSSRASCLYPLSSGLSMCTTMPGSNVVSGCSPRITMHSPNAKDQLCSCILFWVFNSLQMMTSQIKIKIAKMLSISTPQLPVKNHQLLNDKHSSKEMPQRPLKTLCTAAQW